MTVTESDDRRRQIVLAAIESLREVGYAGTSIREIARRGGFNSALISYYFGGLHGLLLAALDYSSETRMERYKAAVEEVTGTEQLLRAAREIYQEDLDGGHITLFTEMVAASLAHRELGPELVARTEPWLELIESTISKIAHENPLLQMIPAPDLAQAILCFYLGANLMTQLDDEFMEIGSVFERAGAFAPLLDSLGG